METHVVVDGYKFTVDKKTGYYLSSKKINGHRLRLHRYIMEKHNGPISEGYEVHHINGDKGNNDISNLQLVRNSAHRKLHGDTESAETKQRKRENVVKKAMPKARKWHGSEEGLRWHRKQGKEVYEKLPVIEITCECCGKKRQVKVVSKNSRFCSNNCKSAWRRQSGVDDQIKKCIICGEEFTVNKYIKKQTCSQKCGARLRWKKRKQE